MLDSGARGPGSSPGRGHCVVFLGKTLFPHSTSTHPGVYLMLGGNYCTLHYILHILFYLVSYTSYIDIVPNKFTISISDI